LGGNLTGIDCQVAAGSLTVEVMPEVFSGTIELLLRLNGEVPMPCAVVSVADQPLARLNDDCLNRPHGQPPPRSCMNRNHFHDWKCRGGTILEQNSAQSRRRKDTTSVPPRTRICVTARFLRRPRPSRPGRCVHDTECLDGGESPSPDAGPSPVRRTGCEPAIGRCQQPVQSASAGAPSSSRPKVNRLSGSFCELFTA